MFVMTSASELFHTRRYRFNHRNTAVDDDDVTPFHSSDSSFSSHQRRPAIRRHGHHYNNLQNSRRDYRHDPDSCEYAPRQFHRHRHRHRHRLASPEHDGHNQSPSAGSIQRRTSTESYTLPGSVLLARQRLVERLRGVSVLSGNSLIGSQNESLQEMAFESGQALRNHPSGLTQDAINCLKLEVFKTKTVASSSECTICLEGFQDGNKLIRLQCAHTFHPCCLFPWVRVSGACPNCRKPIPMN